MEISSNEYSAPTAIEKIKIPGAVLELPPKQHCQFSLFTTKMGQSDPVELIFIETYAPQFIGHNKIFLGSVIPIYYTTMYHDRKQETKMICTQSHTA